MSFHNVETTSLTDCPSVLSAAVRAGPGNPVTQNLVDGGCARATSKTFGTHPYASRSRAGILPIRANPPTLPRGLLRGGNASHVRQIHGNTGDKLSSHLERNKGSDGGRSDQGGGEGNGGNQRSRKGNSYSSGLGASGGNGGGGNGAQNSSAKGRGGGGSKLRPDNGSGKAQGGQEGNANGVPGNNGPGNSNGGKGQGGPQGNANQTPGNDGPGNSNGRNGQGGPQGNADGTPGNNNNPGNNGGKGGVGGGATGNSGGSGGRTGHPNGGGSGAQAWFPNDTTTGSAETLSTIGNSPGSGNPRKTTNQFANPSTAAASPISTSRNGNSSGNNNNNNNGDAGPGGGSDTPSFNGAVKIYISLQDCELNLLPRIGTTRTGVSTTDGNDPATTPIITTVQFAPVIPEATSGSTTRRNVPIMTTPTPITVQLASVVSQTVGTISDSTTPKLSTFAGEGIISTSGSPAFTAIPNQTVEPRSRTGTVAGVIVGSILGLILLLVLLLWYRRRRRQDRIKFALLPTPEQPEMMPSTGTHIQVSTSQATLSDRTGSGFQSGLSGHSVPSTLEIGQSNRTSHSPESPVHHLYLSMPRESIDNSDHSQMGGHPEDLIANDPPSFKNPFDDPPTPGPPTNSQLETDLFDVSQTQALTAKKMRVSQRFSKTSSNRSIRYGYAV
ncbi:hypothetical protein AX15_000615 [Amanita polypyramis BW_CC]|nr:hypothetical protein AX15_000615 [Amanita polypyramis BW_CC]